MTSDSLSLSHMDKHDPGNLMPQDDEDDTDDVGPLGLNRTSLDLSSALMPSSMENAEKPDSDTSDDEWDEAQAQKIYDEIDVMDLLARKVDSTVLSELAEELTHESGTSPLPLEAVAEPPRKLHRPCAACRSAKIKCDYQLPCSRCVRLGIGHLCAPPPDVKRGRPPRKGKQGDQQAAAGTTRAVTTCCEAAPSAELEFSPASAASSSCAPCAGDRTRPSLRRERRSWHCEPEALTRGRPGDLLSRKSSVLVEA